MAKMRDTKAKRAGILPVLVIGDVILDVYHYGAPLKISAETPTLVARNERKTISWGGAALFVRNILELGGKVKFISLLGDDEFALYDKGLAHKNLTKLFVTERERATTTKERFWVNGYKLLQWDHLDNRDIDKRTAEEIISRVHEELPKCDKLLISDYRHGLITKELAAELVKGAKKAGKPIYVDSQLSQREGNLVWYKGADLFCVNLREAQAVEPFFSEDDLEVSFKRLSNILDSRRVVLKQEAKGSTAYLDGKVIHTPAHKVTTVDTTGAGDAFYSALATSAFPPDEDALLRANKWAGLSTAIHGAKPPNLSDLIR